MEKQVSGKKGLFTPEELEIAHRNSEITRLKAEILDLREQLAIPGLQAWKLIKMEKQVSGKKGLFTPEELDVIICALIHQQSELRELLPLVEKYASPEHLGNHSARIALGEGLLEDLQR